MKQLQSLLVAVLFIIAGTVIKCIAQPPRFEHIGTRQGLPSMELICLTQDSKGYLWVGTVNGLARYDGIGFTPFQNSETDSNSLADNLVYCLFEDRAGTLWVGTQDGGLNRFNPKHQNFTIYKNKPGNSKSLISNNIRAIFEDSKGNLWIGTGIGLELMDRQTGSFKHIKLSFTGKTDQKYNIRSIYEDRKKRLWVGTDYGLFLLDNFQHTGEPTFVLYNNDPGVGSAVSIFEDSAGNLWIGSYFHGVNCLDPATGKIRHYPPDPNNPFTVSHKSVTSFYEAPDKKIWMTTNGGMNVFDPATKQFSRYPHDPSDPQSLSSNFNNRMIADRSGILWIATFGGGLNKYNPYINAFHHFYSNPGNPNSLSYNSVLSIFGDSRGNLWIGTVNGLNKFKPAQSSFDRYYVIGPDGIADVNANEIHSIAEAENGWLWLATYNGLKKFDPSTGRFQDLKKRFPNSAIHNENWISGLLASGPDTLWTLLNNDAFLGLFNPTTGAYVRDVRGMKNGRLGTNMLKQNEHLWVSTETGLYLLNTINQKVTKFTHDPANPQSLSNSMVYSLHLDPSGILWVGTANGLNRMEPGKKTGQFYFKRFGIGDGLPDVIINGILEDDDGYLWLSTMKGLARFHPQYHTCRNYTYLDGLQDNVFNQTACWKDPSTGRLFFGGANGFNVFHPSEIFDDTIAPPVAFTGFRLLNGNAETSMNNHISTLSELEVRWADKAFAIQFAALNFTAPEQNQYAIIMEGFDKNWRNLGNAREATYTNLSPGRYTFRVKACNKDGVWNEQGASINIKILPPLWATWWAFTGYLLVAGGILYAFFKLQVRRNEDKAEARRLQALSDAKSTFLSTVSHELRTPLTSIMGFTKIIKKRLEEKILPFTDLTDAKRAKAAEQVLGNLDIVVQESERLTSLINQVLDLAKIEAGKVDWHMEPINMDALLDRAVATTSFLFENGNVKLIKQPCPALPLVSGDHDRLLQVVVNLISNAAKFTESGHVRCSVKRLDDLNIEVSIQDTGIGIDEKDQPAVFEKFKQVGDDTLTDKPQGTGLGLSICKEIVEHHGGRIWLESKPGVGSTFLFTLPISQP